MKKNFFLILLLVIPCLCYSQIGFRHCFYAEEMWGDWSNAYGKVISPARDGFVIHSTTSHPSEWIAKVVYRADSNKKSINARYKSKEWEKIPCTVIFRHPSGLYSLKDLMLLNFKRGGKEERHVGKILIAPYKYKKGMDTFNVFIDDYGLGIHLTDNTIVWRKD